MAERKGDTKDTLLDELESIKGLLDDEDAIPVLREVIESIEPLDDSEPQQPSLFQAPHAPQKPSTPARRPSSVTRASGENPFLPEHIRARLHGNRPPPQWEPPAPDASEPTASPNDAALIDRQQLIDQLVAENLPTLESRLRQRLSEASEEQLQHWLNTPADDQP